MKGLVWLRFLLLLLIGGVLSLSFRAEPLRVWPKKRPNIIYILADDLGYGDLSCYGQVRFRTPNLDRMAAEGLRFTQFYSGSTVCAPSRCALMSGQHTGHAYIRGNGEIPLREQDVILPQYLKQAGYATGMFGKWGLGVPGTSGSPEKKGWDAFFGYPHHVQAHFQYPDTLWQLTNGQVGPVVMQGRPFANDVIVERALDFMQENRQKPFFLYLALTIPHAELRVPQDAMAPFQTFDGRSRFEPETPYPGAHYGPQPQPRAAYAAMIRKVDDYVGAVMNQLNDLGLTDETLVMFSSDNGTHVEGGRTAGDVTFFQSSGPYRGIKRDLYEGGIRVPFIVRWPGAVPAGKTVTAPTANWDLLPTLLELTRQRATPPLDGVSLVPLLRGKSPKNDRVFYWEFHEKGFSQAVRKGDWKLIRFYRPNMEPRTELYRLDTDPTEQRDLAGQEPERVKELEQLMNQSRTPAEHPAFRAKLLAGER